jgi:hypothetical protein
LTGTKKDPGVPNLHPLKEKILADFVARKEKAEQELHRQKEVRCVDVANRLLPDNNVI